MAEITTAVAGLVGVVIGGGITSLQKWLEYRASRATARGYLSVRVTCEIDHYCEACLAVAHDDGEYNEQGLVETSVPSPNFDVSALDVDWKSIEPALCYRILNMPAVIRSARETIGPKWEADPPDFWQYFRARKKGHCELGLTAFGIAASLRQSAGLPQSDFDFSGAFKTVLSEVAAEDTEREARHLAFRASSPHIFPVVTD
ncbi:hypothetical protein QTI51_24520 [Variovorax sp. J22G73]|uniref:hypothetical protein n=1 Tax=unclassified Variovorax TaxID=663243 RepID=UPI0025790605|nr:MULTISPECIES: hypothetical protein [unclassified Variovorax]MDM0007912.1 hypothetical protein [Variovorax sp. J22R203]MDM0100465.1 hypothetical protein [Variovorax sp. J22G73]